VQPVDSHEDQLVSGVVRLTGETHHAENAVGAVIRRAQPQRIVEREHAG